MKTDSVVGISFIGSIMLAGKPESSVRIDEHGNLRGHFKLQEVKSGRVTLAKGDGRSFNVPMDVCCFNLAPPKPLPSSAE